VRQLSSPELTVFLLSLAALLGAARILGDLARWCRQPAVLGEIIAGILLGPSVFGAIAPEWQSWLFPAEGAGAVALGSVTSLAVIMFLLVAGLEVDLSMVWRQGPTALKVGAAGMVVPFAVGFACALAIPVFVGRHAGADPLIFALFFATALAISALPVIAKTLMDLNLYRTDLGMLIISAAMIDDLTGWTVFAVILGLMDKTPGHGPGVLQTVILTLLFAGLTLSVGRWLINRVLPLVQSFSHGGGVLGFALALAFVGAALTEHIGVHAIFGAFLIGVAIGDSPHLRERSRVVIDQFVSYAIAPIFFASIGLKVNFITDYDPWLTTVVIVIACAGKLAGAGLGARWAGLPTRSRWAVGFAMNARGAMEIILGLLALEAGVIEPPLFVALVVMALFTSLAGGPLIRWVLALAPPPKLAASLSPELFCGEISGSTRHEAVKELVALAAEAGHLDPGTIESAVWEREEAAATGIGNGVAIPRAQVAGLTAPLVAVGLSEAGIDFDAPDGDPAHVVFLLLTPHEEPETQLDLLAEIARVFHDRRTAVRAVRARTHGEFLAALAPHAT
jgi:Kef-type K+ transport system membrane component KefB/mannitol/fructose-specific phosphotransferase system IIA component (Ntr-type)